MNYDTLNTQEKFASKWLFEMPQQTGSLDHTKDQNYQNLLLVLKTNIDNGSEITPHNNGLKSIQVDNNLIYWDELHGTPQNIIELEPFHGNYAVTLIGKLPGSASRTYRFYENLIQSCSGNLIFSGHLISDEGIDIWKNLLSKTNAKLFGYDYTNTRDYTRIASEKDLETYLGDTPDFQKRRFVLSENIKRLTGEVWTSFEMMKIYKNTFHIVD